MRLRLAILALPAVLALAALGACQDESEGQVCDPRAGNDDCQSGLVCTAITGVSGNRCCPPNRATATTPECAGTPVATDASPAPPDGTAPTPEASTDGAGSDATTDGAAPQPDAGMDAATDGSPSDSGGDGNADASTDADASDATSVDGSDGSTTQGEAGTGDAALLDATGAPG